MAVSVSSQERCEEVAAVAAPACQRQRRARMDRRTARTRLALRDALVAEIHASGGLDRVSVTAITERADVTRRTFYSHFRDIPDLVAQTEAEVLDGLSDHIRAIAQVRLDRLAANLDALEPCPGSVELLEYVRENGDYLVAMLGPGGDPALVEKIKRMAIQTVTDRALDGLTAPAVGPFFDYYLSFAVSAEVGVLQRWLEGGMREPVQTMASIMTVLMFVRPGDLYGRPIDINLPLYGAVLLRQLASAASPAPAETAVPAETATPAAPTVAPVTATRPGENL